MAAVHDGDELAFYSHTFSRRSHSPVWCLEILNQKEAYVKVCSIVHFTVMNQNWNAGGRA